MNPIFRVENNFGNTLYIPHQFTTYAESYLSRDMVIGTSGNTFYVQSTTNFDTSRRNLLLGHVGAQNCENILTLSSKTSTTITGAAANIYAHNVGEPVTQVDFSLISIQSSPTSSPSGTWTTVGNVNIQFNESETVYQHTTGTAGLYYRIRLTDGSGTFSAYSNGGTGITDTSFGDTSVGKMIASVRSAVGNTELDDQFFLNALNDARRIVDTSFGYGRLNEWRHNFEYPIQMLAGTNFVTLPSNIDFTETNRTLLAARYARQSVAANVPLKYVDKREWNQRAYLNRYSITVGSTTSGSTSIVLSSTGDFPSSGTILIATELPTQTILSVTYTSNNLLTNTLSGCSGISRTIADGTQVWAYSTFAVPYFFTVFDDQAGNHKLWFDRPIPAGLQGKNLYIDYYEKIVDLSNLSDPIPEHYRDVYKDYLKFAIKRRRDDSIGEDDEDYKKFMRGLQNILGNPYTGQSQIIIQ